MNIFWIGVSLVNFFALGVLFGAYMQYRHPSLGKCTNCGGDSRNCGDQHQDNSPELKPSGVVKSNEPCNTGSPSINNKPLPLDSLAESLRKREDAIEKIKEIKKKIAKSNQKNSVRAF